MSTICIYHGNCADGFTAAWAVRKALGDIEFHAGVYQSPPPNVTGKDVVIVDFSYKYDVLVEMSFKAKSILILDHHKSAADDLGRLFFAGRNYQEFLHDCRIECYCNNAPHIGVLFDMERSGAGLTWDFFFPDAPRPRLIDHVEDRDLWRFNLPNTREIQANIFSYPYDFEVWDRLAASDCKELAAEGCAIERKHFKDINELLKVTGRRMVIGGVDVPVANLPYTMSSDAGHQMAIGEPFAACYYDTTNGRCFSLRSNDAGMDVSDIAKMYGGGGHRNAAGFTLPWGREL